MRLNKQLKETNRLEHEMVVWFYTAMTHGVSGTLSSGAWSNSPPCRNLLSGCRSLLGYNQLWAWSQVPQLLQVSMLRCAS